MLVRDVMTHPAYSLPRGAALEAAVQLLARAHISAVPIVDPDDHVVGIVSEADILRAPLAQDPRAHMRPTPPTPPWPTTVDEVMTYGPMCVSPGSDCAEAAALLATHGWKSVPVVSEDRLVGVLSRSDLLRAMTRPDSELCRDLHNAFADLGHDSWVAKARAGRVVVRGVTIPAEAGVARAVAATIPGVRAVVVQDDAIGADPRDGVR